MAGQLPVDSLIEQEREVIAPLTAEQRQRLVESAANGEVSLAEALSICNQPGFIEDVNRSRRSRLIRFIARSIASDIDRGGGQ